MAHRIRHGLRSRWVLLGLVCLAAGGAALAERGNPPLIASALAGAAGLEGRVMWVDAQANLAALSTPEGIDRIFEQCHRAGINTVVIDVKPLSGYVLYPSRVAPVLREWRGVPWPQEHDLILHAMHQARRRGMKVHINVNVFSEGHKLFTAGPIYERPEQQAIVYETRRTVTAANGARRQLMMGTNFGPRPDQISVHDNTETRPRSIGTNGAAVVVLRDEVVAVLQGGIPGQPPLSAPPDGYILFGNGEGARWLLENVKVGETLAWEAEDVFLPITELDSDAYGLFINPAHPDAREYALRVVEEIADTYAIDGIVLDRMRYSGLNTDFSDLSRQQFESWLGRLVPNWPGDVFAYSETPGRRLVRGPLFQQWLEWRASVIRDWLAEASERVRRVRPGCQIGVYVGSWYSSYYDVGVNWAADDYRAAFDWMSPEYHRTGYAGLVDWISTGCYYPLVRREEALLAGAPEAFTVEVAAEEATRIINNATFHYAGLFLTDYRDRPDQFRRAVQMALDRSQGVMLFDLIYVEEYGWWDLLGELFPAPKRAPHDIPGLLDALRQTHRALAGGPR